MGYVYLAYLEDDRGFVAHLTRQLEDAGFRVWQAEESARAQKSSQEAIDRAIREASAVLVVLTPAASASPQVMYEWMFALGAGIPVIPLMVEVCEVPTRLAEQTLDFSEAGVRPWGRLLRLVREAHLRAKSAQEEGKNTSSRRSGLLRRAARRVAASSSEDDERFWATVDEDDPLEKLRVALDSNDRDQRLRAVRRLEEIGGRGAVRALIKALRAEDWRVREEAAGVLGRLHAVAAVPALLEALRQARPGPFGNNSGAAIVQALRTMGAEAVPVLIDAFDDDNLRLRSVIVDILGTVGGPDALSALIGALQDGEPRVRWRAINALGRLGDEAAVPGLLALLEDVELEVRIAAAAALGQIGGPDAIEGLVRMLYDPTWRARWAAAQALWEIGADAVPVLLEALHADNARVRQAATRTLAEIGGPAIEGLVATLHDQDWDVRWCAAETLWEIGDRAVPALVRALDSDDWQAAWTAAEALRRIGTPLALKAVAQWQNERTSEGGTERLGGPGESEDGLGEL